MAAKPRRHSLSLPKNRRPGFTLLELLVVIGIIAVFIAMLLPATRGTREAARRSQCTNNLKQIGLGLQNYGDVYNCFPADAVWGDGTCELPQPRYHYPWTVAILPFIEQKPIYDEINKRIPIMANPNAPATFTGQSSLTTPPAYGGNGFPLLQSQQLPAFRCPSDHVLNGPGSMPMTMMWSNYAASEGVGYYPAMLVETEEGERPAGSAPEDHKGIFPFAEHTKIKGVRDGSASTIAVAEVTAGGVCNQLMAGDRSITTQKTPMVSYSGAIPGPPDWSLANEGKTSGFPLQAGTGRPRSTLFTSLQPKTPAPMVFRALWAAVTNSVTGGAPCSGGDFYRGALGGTCGDDGFELKSNKGASPPLYGVAPTYNALYPPNSDWPGPDSLHPGAIIAVFADGHTRTVQQNIDYRIWAALNTRAGNETVKNDF